MNGPSLERLTSAVGTVVRRTRRENVSLLAGSIAYSAFVSLLPLLALLLFVTAAVGREPLSERVVDLTRGVLAPAAQGMIAEALANASARTGASLVGLATLLWGTLKLFRGLDVAFSEIYGTTAHNSLAHQLKDSVVVLLALGLAVVMAVVASAALVVFEGSALVGLASPLLLIAGLSLSFFPIYYVFPDVRLSVGEVLPGVLTAAVGWAALQWLFGIYLVLSDKRELYGVLGGVLLLLTWLYLGGYVVLVGGVVNAVLAGRSGQPKLDGSARRRPEEGSVE